MSKEKAIEKIQYATMQVASVYACSDGMDSIGTSLDSNSCFNFKYIMESCTFDDGTPFGVKMEE